MSAPATADSGLVPLSDRIRGLQACRPVLVAGALAAYAVTGTVHGASTAWVLAASAAYLLLSATTLLAPRAGRALALRLNGWGLLLDGLYLAATSYGYHGYAHPVSALLLVHLVSVALLASFRSGLKVAVWNTLLMAVLHQLQTDGVVPVAVPSSDRSVVLAIGGVWLVTLTTAAFAAANERELRRRHYDSAALARLSLRLEASLEPTEVAAALLDAVTEDYQLERALVLAAGPAGLEHLAGRGHAATGAGTGPGTGSGADPGADHMVRLAVEEHRSVRVARLDRGRDPWLAAALPDAGNLIVVPLYADGALAAVLVTEHGRRRGARVERRQVEMLERYASHAALALVNARLLGQVRRLADTDGLTGVANRRTFDRVLDVELARAARSGRPVALLMVDIDHFKRLNDAHGHQSGDVALQRVAGALQGAVRRGDLLARYGGEEFAVIVPDTAPERVAELAERLRAAVAAACDAPPVTASLGAATSLDGVAGAAELLAAADRALYRSKAAGRDRVTAVVLASAGAPVPA